MEITEASDGTSVPRASGRARLSAGANAVVQKGKKVTTELGRKGANLKSDFREVKADIRAGHDGLGAVVKVAGKKSQRVDTFLHCCNGVGCACASRHRVKLLSLAILLGVGCFATALCGSFGLGTFAIKAVPWAKYRHVAFNFRMLTWWNTGPRLAEADSLTSDLLRPENLDGLFSSSACEGQPSADACVRALQDDPNSELADVSWLLNQWGLCLLPNAATDGWITSMLLNGGNGGALTILSNGAACRPWSEFRKEWMLGGDEGRDAIMQCARPAVDGFSLVMGAFGGFMKMLEPLSRMRTSTDTHQKTAVLIIIGVSLIAPVIGLISFGTGCVDGVSQSLSRQFGKDLELGSGCLLFAVSLVLLAPIAAIHIVIPSSVTTARGANKEEVETAAVAATATKEVV